MNKNKLSANQLFWILNIAWMLLNLLQASVTELANDEAYYVVFAKHLDWGYYDHPPMIALFIYLGQWLSGELGVRLLTVLSQPIYIWLLWKLIAPATVEKKRCLVIFHHRFGYAHIAYLWVCSGSRCTSDAFFSTIFILLCAVSATYILVLYSIHGIGNSRHWL